MAGPLSPGWPDYTWQEARPHPEVEQNGPRQQDPTQSGTLFSNWWDPTEGNVISPSTRRGRTQFSWRFIDTEITPLTFLCHPHRPTAVWSGEKSDPSLVQSPPLSSPKVLGSGNKACVSVRGSLENRWYTWNGIIWGEFGKGLIYKDVNGA